MWRLLSNILKPYDTYHYFLSRWGRERSLNCIAYAARGSLYLDNLVVCGMLPKRIGEHLPILGGIPVAQEITSLAAPNWMSRGEQIRSDLSLRHYRLLIVWQLHGRATLPW